TTEVDMERASEAREALNKQLGDQGGGKVSFNDIIIKATAHALTKHPACNAWFQEDHIRSWHEVHIGMAVAVEDGLITPVIRNADHHELRPPRDRRRDGGGVPQDAQADAGEPAGDVTVNAEVGTRNAEHLRTVPRSHFRIPRWGRGTIGERV